MIRKVRRLVARRNDHEGRARPNVEEIAKETTKIPASHAQSLPFEIVEAIFIHFPARLCIEKCHEFPWFLGHICSWWRGAFLGMKAQFWSSIGIYWEQSPSQAVKPRLATEIVTFFLRCSPPKDPFSFSFQLCSYTPAEWIYLFSIFHTLVEESPRWSKVFISIDESLIPVFHRIRNRVPLLEDLQLYLRKGIDHSGDHVDIFDLADVFAAAPSLTRVSLQVIRGWKFNWSALTKLELHRTGNVPNFLAVLAQMQNLERLDISEDYPSDKRTLHPVTLPSLKELSSCGTSLFSVLTAPALQQLSIDFHCARSLSHNTTTSFFDRSGCTILKLKLTLCRATKVIEIVRDLPHIVHLSLNRTTYLKDIIHWLTYYRQQQCPARHLQSVTITPFVVPIPVEELEALRNMIVSRSNRSYRTNYEDVGKLKVLTIVEPGTPIEWFDKVRKACNDLQIQFRHDCHDGVSVNL